MHILIFYAPLQLFPGVNVSHLKNKMAGPLTGLGPRRDAFGPVVSLSPGSGERQVWVGLARGMY